MSGRRCNKSEGKPTGIGGGGSCSGATGIEKVDAGWPDQRGDGMLKLRSLHAHVEGLRLGGLKLRLRLRHFHPGSQAALVTVGGEVQAFWYCTTVESSNSFCESSPRNVK